MPDRIQIRFGLEEKWEEMIGIPYSGQFFIAFPPKAQNHQNQAGLLACLVLPAFSDARWYIRLDPMARLAKSVPIPVCSGMADLQLRGQLRYHTGFPFNPSLKILNDGTRFRCKLRFKIDFKKADLKHFLFCKRSCSYF